MEPEKRIISAFMIVLLIIVMGTMAYYFILGWTFWDSFYMTLITVSTTGYMEVHPLDATGRAVTICLIIIGVGSALYAFGTVAQYIVEGHIRNLFRRKRMEKEARRLSGHVIVCGYGRMGKILVDELRQRHIPLVVVEKSPAIIDSLGDSHVPVIQGDATSDEILTKANVNRARAIVSVVESDAENLYITLSARELNRDIFIVARCSEEHAVAKLYRAGASKVVFPYGVGAREMAEFIARPNIMKFLETVLLPGDLQLGIQEFTVPEGSFLAGVTLQHSGLRRNYNVIVVAARRAGKEEMAFNPGMDYVLAAGDILVVLGEPDKLGQLLTDLGVSGSPGAR